jgi:hypothetical protein
MFKQNNNDDYLYIPEKVVSYTMRFNYTQNALQRFLRGEKVTTLTLSSQNIYPVDFLDKLLFTSMDEKNTECWFNNPAHAKARPENLMQLDLI